MTKKDIKPQSFDYKGFADSLFELYTQNSFGSVSKRELDLYLFSKFKEMGIIQGESSWDISKDLKISKNKAQTLLYESQLRYPLLDEKELVKKALDKIPQSFDKGVFSLIVDDRFVRDCMRNFLAKHGFVSDLSFASDIIKVPVDAYWALQDEFNKDAVKSLKKRRLYKKCEVSWQGRIFWNYKQAWRRNGWTSGIKNSIIIP